MQIFQNKNGKGIDNLQRLCYNGIDAFGERQFFCAIRVKKKFWRIRINCRFIYMERPRFVGKYDEY